MFREFPYLYEGSLDYERNYLSTYPKSADSIAVFLVDDDRVVGASTGLPMAAETSGFSHSVILQGYNPESFFYCAESVLLPEYRGLGYYKIFINTRENHARTLGMKYIGFCAVDRPPNHPMCPPNWRAPNAIWSHHGYRQNESLKAQYRWRDIGESEESIHHLTYWIKRLVDH